MNIELTKENLKDWKAELRRMMWKQHRIGKYDETLLDEDWLQDFLGATPQDAIDAETECWEL
jgi:hypothetical protein